jgi:hypothetical protein
MWVKCNILIHKMETIKWLTFTWLLYLSSHKDITYW